MNRFSFRGAGKLLAGYTIVEVTLFLAISGGILVASTALLSGRQERVRFTQTVNGMEDELRDIFNDTSTGFFPSRSDFSCQIQGTDYRAKPVFPSGTTEQGGNTGCIFVGKLITFITDANGPDEFDGSYDVYTIVGTREVTAQTLDIFQIPFKILGSTNQASGAQAPGILDNYDVPANVKLTSYLVDTSTGEAYNSIAILSDFGEQSGIGFTGNAARVKLYGYTGRPYNDNNGLVADNTPRAEFDEITGPLVICLNQDNISGRPAAISITKELTISREIDSQPPECEGHRL